MITTVAITRQGLNLNGVLLSDHPVAKFSTKREAVSLARSKGWRAADVSLAFNRFGEFWVVGQQYTAGLYRLLLKDGSTWDVPLRP